MSKSFVIGCGAGFSADRLDPAVALARSGQVDCLVFECVGERTLAFGLDTLGEWFEDRATIDRILADNPARLYGL